MAKLELTEKDDYRFTLPCAVSLLKYNGPLFHSTSNFPHPGALINTSWTNLINRSWNFLDACDAFQKAEKLALPKKYASKDIGAPSLEKVSAEYRSVIYAATELIENLLDNLKICLLPKNKYQEWKPNIVARWRNHPTVICNKLKHEHNVLANVAVNYPLGSVKGYAVCFYSGDELKVNKLFHAKQQAFSYGSDIRKILTHVYLIADAVKNEIERIGSEFGQKNLELKEDSQLKDFLERVSNFMPLAFHDQKAADTPEFRFSADKLLIADSDGSLLPNGGVAKVQVTYSGDGYTRTFPIFYR